MDTERLILKLKSANIPGPSPWYLCNSGLTYQTKNGLLSWTDIDDKKYKNSSGKTILVNENSDVYIILDFQCYVMKITESIILLWFLQKRKNKNDKEIPDKIIINLIDLNELNSINLNKIDFNIVNTLNKFIADNKIESYIEIPSDLEYGNHLIHVPLEFQNFENILILEHSSSYDKVSNYFDTMNVCLYEVDFQKGTVDIVPQDWFNQGAYDFMYQWPTRIFRDIKTNKVFGSGIRINNFVLDNTLRNVEIWF